MVVPENGGIHTGKAVEAARPGLAKVGLVRYDLPPGRPKLDRSEPVFKQVKHHEMPTRSFATKADHRKAVEDGFDAYRRWLRAKCDNELRLAA